MNSLEWRKQSNIQTFLHKTTPFVTSKSIPKACIRDSDNLQWQSIEKETVDYFTLADLWDQYYEYSVYGLGVPIHHVHGNAVVQFYVPHLSGIQLYTSKSTSSRNVEEETTEWDSWSDDSASDKLSRYWDATSEESASEGDGSWPVIDRIGQLYLQYIEYSPPYSRIPLVYKVMELARSYPGLLSLKSTELCPSSWMSISWYPICHLPAQKNLKELGASFLTFHTISSTFQDDCVSEYAEKDLSSSSTDDSQEQLKGEVKFVSLPPFGLATYKMHGSSWINPAMGDYHTLGSLYSAADSWLKQLKIDHHDFNFFATHST